MVVADRAMRVGDPRVDRGPARLDRERLEVGVVRAVGRALGERGVTFAEQRLEPELLAERRVVLAEQRAGPAEMRGGERGRAVVERDPAEREVRQRRPGLALDRLVEVAADLLG